MGTFTTTRAIMICREIKGDNMKKIESGQGTVEYPLILILVAGAVIELLGTRLSALACEVFAYFGIFLSQCP